MDTKPSPFIPLSLDEGVKDRPFTEPSYTGTDVEHIRCMLGRLQETLAARPELRRRKPANRILLSEDGDRPHQLIIARPDDLRRVQDIVVVGFFGRMKADAEQVTLSAVKEVDEELIGDFPRFGGVLSYNSMRLPEGNWANMALFKSLEAMERWSKNRRHENAIRQLAALHYESIRLHVGVARGGLFSGNLELVRTKYYQFNGPVVWRGIRLRMVSSEIPPQPPAAPTTPPSEQPL